MTEVERTDRLMQLLWAAQKGNNNFLILPILQALSETLNVPYKWETR